MAYDDVLVLLDFTSKDELALRAARALAPGGPLRLIHVMRSGEGDPDELARIDDARRRAAIERLERYAEELSNEADLEARCEVATGAQLEQLVKRADRRDTLLVLVPDRAAASPRPEALELLEIAASVPCSVLLVR